MSAGSLRRRMLKAQKKIENKARESEEKGKFIDLLKQVTGAQKPTDLNAQQVDFLRTEVFAFLQKMNDKDSFTEKFMLPKGEFELSIRRVMP